MKHNKEIVISPTRVVTALIVFLMLVTAGFIIVPRIPTLFPQESNGLTAEAAARAGVEAFLSVDAKAGKINLSHGPIASLDWPGMTMDFDVQDMALLTDLKPGQKVTFNNNDPKCTSLNLRNL